MYQDYKDLLSAFQAHGVRYLIVGDYAVISHSHRAIPKTSTSSSRQDHTNTLATFAALSEFGVPLQGIEPDDFADPASFFRFGRDPRGFDILPEAAWITASKA